MALTATLDRTPPTYAEGETITLTVTTSPGERDTTVETPGTVHIDVPGVGTADVVYVLTKPGDPVDVVVTDPDLIWVEESDDGDVAVFTAIA